MKIGIVGAGQVGATAAYAMTMHGIVEDRDAERARALEPRGARVAALLADLAACDIVDGRYSPPGMTAPLAVKDLRLALAEAEHQAVPMPVASLVHDRLVGVVARGWGGLDWSALGLLAAAEAGLDASITAALASKQS